jgi:hypothetical protein
LFYEDQERRERKEEWKNSSKVQVLYGKKKRPGEFGKELDREGEIME